MKTIILFLSFFLSLSIFGQETFELKLNQTNHLCCLYEVKIVNGRLTIRLLKPKNKKIYNKKIRNIECLEKIKKLIDSKEFETLKDSYEKQILDGYKWEYKIKYGKKEYRIVNENDSVEILFKLNRLINESIRNKKKRVLIEMA